MTYDIPITLFWNNLVSFQLNNYYYLKCCFQNLRLKIILLTIHYIFVKTNCICSLKESEETNYVLHP